MTAAIRLSDRLERAGVRRLAHLPAPVLRRLAGAPRRNDRGAVLDPQVQLLLRLRNLTGRGEFDRLGPQRAREENERSGYVVDLDPEPLARVEDRTVPGADGDLAVRVYVPSEAGGLPVLVWLHGGGFVIGSLDSHDAFCRRLASRSGCVVVSVDYRLAPEHRFPAAVDDAFAAVRSVAAEAERFGGDPAKLAVGGDSAGGNLAAVTSRLARDAGGPPLVVQALVYPATDLRRRHTSHRLFGEGHFLTSRMIDWFMRLYLEDPAQESDPKASPLLADDLSGLPPTIVYTGGFDPLRDEGEDYAGRLRTANVPVTQRSCDGLVHGFVNMGGVVDAARDAIDRLAADVRGHFG